MTSTTHRDIAYLKLHGVAVKEHAVFRELTRVKQYFEKIKEAEEGPAKRRENLSLNKQAAGRFIKQALVGHHAFSIEIQILIGLGGQ